MKRLRVLLLLIVAFGFLAARADDASTYQRLAEWVKKARNFDTEYTREKVYVHLDNNAYFVGETMWLKAYVLRASTLRPALEQSRVLYVDLLNSEGEVVQQKLLRIDDQGQAEGEFQLLPPVSSGYYEVRAYTRAMTNWGVEAAYSRVIPIFDARNQDDDPSSLSIAMPTEKFEMPFGHRRPLALEKEQRLTMQFFPEGGNRVTGEEQRIAYKISNGRGKGVATTVQVARPNGVVVATSSTGADGMGLFTLPAGIPASERLVAVLLNDSGAEGSKQAFVLPAVDPAARYVLRVDPEADKVKVNIRSCPNAEPRLLGLLISCRTHTVYFDTLTIYSDDNLELAFPRSVFRDGVNTVDLFDESGHSLCRRLVWNSPNNISTLHLGVRQNEREYEPYAPVALDLHLTDQTGRGVTGTTFSVSVRNADADVVNSPLTDMATELLLSSEVRGYVDHPERYFEADDDAHRDALNLLLMVQGWSADDFETMAGVEPFDLRQPVEDQLILRGQVLHDNDKHVPWPDLDLHLQMYSLEGASIEGDVTTDDDGRFAFKSNMDYCGTWYAQITTKESLTGRRGNETEKRRWSRVTLDRWFAPELRPFAPGELELVPPTPLAASTVDAPQAEPELFEWEDTIPRVMSRHLDEARVIGQGKYRGLIGNRYTYNGGEKAGLRHSSFYINMERDNERRKDEGRGEGTMLEVLGKAVGHAITTQQPFALDKSTKPKKNTNRADTNDVLDLTSVSDVSDISATYESGPEAADGDYVLMGGDRFWVVGDEYVKNNAPAIRINNTPCIFFLNNDLVGYGYETSQVIDEDDFASEFKSAVIMTERKDWMAFWPIGRTTNCPRKKDPYYDGKPYYGVFLYNRAEPFRFYTKKGIDKRLVQGYSVPKKFFEPQYNGIDEPSPDDCRRTLCWRPDVTTDALGHASLVFYNDANAQHIVVSARGVTPDGRFIYYEH